MAYVHAARTGGASSVICPLTGRWPNPILFLICRGWAAMQRTPRLKVCKIKEVQGGSYARNPTG